LFNDLAKNNINCVNKKNKFWNSINN
jgi:hypothetical protein